ncbi:MAG: NDP-sugar synthase [Thermoplasmata archaeon]|nr:NDP-sugar synthase [Euryarchaeota archaeon]RLF67150.1 MAG: NDP-sugar synthase [Thermoplasmata archaeon]
MKAVVLAGGYATRLWPLTISRPKPLLPLGKKLIIDYILEEIVNIPCDKIIISTNRAFAPYFKRWIEKKTQEISTLEKQLELFIEDTTSEEEKLGTIAALEKVMEHFGKDHYIVIAGDNIFSYKLSDFYEKYDLINPLIAVYDIKDINLVPLYSQVVVDEEGKVLEFEEKPINPRTTLIATACYAFPPDTIDLIKEYLSLGLKRDSPGFFIQWLHKRRAVFAYKFEGYWFDIGTPRTYLEAHKALLRESFVSDAAEIEEGVKIVPPVHIEDEVIIRGNSIIGPHVYVGRKALIEDAEISGSIIMCGSEIKGSTIRRSIVGEKVVINELNIENSVIGDHTKLYHRK